MIDSVISAGGLGPTRVRRFLWAVALLALTIPARTAARRGPVWVRLELVENTAEGPAFDRCEIEETLGTGQEARWRVFYGEARADPNSGWAAVRTRSGCARAGPDTAEVEWTLVGSPYLQVDVALGHAIVSGREVLIEAAFSIRKLTGFKQGGDPAYETRTDKRTIRLPEGGSAAIPVLIASRRETDEFRVRELLMKFSADVEGSRPRTEYGEIAVSADVPRAEIFLDGGFVGRTSSDNPVVLRAVRAGEREVAVRDASRREARAIARVKKGRRTPVSLNLLKNLPDSRDGLRALGPNPQGSEEFWRDKDGAIMVRIPGGEFQMGSPEGEGEASEHPQHAVRVNGFLIDKTEVTWGQYRRFVTEVGHPPPASPVWGMPEAFPASNLTWNDADGFCAWAGGRLPTEAEWERAARGDDSRQYPWGNTWEPWRSNTRDGGPHAPTPTGAYPEGASPYGVLDLAGSVWEWCSDWFDAEYYAKSPVENPTGPAAGSSRVSRGGEWMSPAFWTRTATRQGIDPIWPNPMRGFRCVQDDRKEKGK